MQLQTSMASKWRLIYFLITVLLAIACGPSQEELRIGALEHFNRGNQHINNQNPSAAIKEYRMAIALDDRQAVFYYNLGLAYYTLVLYDQAIEAYLNAIREQPDFAEAWYNLSLAYDKTENSEKAFMAYEKYQTLSRTPSE
jgi:tetratricopeptide (TPR) repeat protein